MATEIKPGQTVQIKISKTINRQGARKTLERLFLLDKTVAKPLNVRSANFEEIPKRRGGCIWTKRPNKLHLNLTRGDVATIKTTAQIVKDLTSVQSFVQVEAK